MRDLFLFAIQTYGHNFSFAQTIKYRPHITFLFFNNGREQGNWRGFGSFNNFIRDLFDGTFVDWFSATWAVRQANAAPEETKVIINFRDCTHRRAGVSHGSALIKRDGWRKTSDFVHVRFVLEF